MYCWKLIIATFLRITVLTNLWELVNYWHNCYNNKMVTFWDTMCRTRLLLSALYSVNVWSTECGWLHQHVPAASNSNWWCAEIHLQLHRLTTGRQPAAVRCRWTRSMWRGCEGLVRLHFLACFVTYFHDNSWLDFSHYHISPTICRPNLY